MYVELEIVYCSPVRVQTVHVRGDKEFLTSYLIKKCEVKKLKSCTTDQSQSTPKEIDGKLTMELIITPGGQWRDAETKLIKMDIIAFLEQEKFKIIPNSMVFDQVNGREKFMMYKD